MSGKWSPYDEARMRVRVATEMIKAGGLSGIDPLAFLAAMQDGYKAAYDLMEGFPSNRGTYLAIRTYLIESAAASQSWIARNGGKPPTIGAS